MKFSSLFLLFALAALAFWGCTEDDEVKLTYPLAGFAITMPDSTDNRRIVLENNSQDAVSYLWDFGDGAQSTALSPSHRYELPGTYIIRLTALSKDSLVDYARRSFMIPDSGNLSFSYFNAGCEVPCEVMFEAYAPEAASVRWDFGDGSQSEELNPVHQYLEHGTYTVRLEAEMPNGIQRVSQTLVLAPDGTLPVAEFLFSGGVCGAPCEVSFTNTSENAERYEWDFGDGNQSAQENPTHTFRFAGTYRVVLRAYNGAGYDEYVRSVKVR